jgi:hypothetical protein
MEETASLRLDSLFISGSIPIISDSRSGNGNAHYFFMGV